MRHQSTDAMPKMTRLSILVSALFLLAAAGGCGARDDSQPRRELVGGIDLIPEYIMVGELKHLVVQGDFAYGIALGKLLIVDISDPSTPAKAAEIDVSDLSWIRGIAANETNLLIAAGPNNDEVYLYVVDTTNHDSLRIKGSIKLFDKTRGHRVPSPVRELSIVSADEHVYVVGFSNLMVVDVSDDSRPKLIADIRELGGYRALNISSRHMVRFGNSVLGVFDTRERSSPTVIGQANVGSINISAVAASDDLVYVGGRGSHPESGLQVNGLFVFDLSDPTSPRRIGETSLGAGVMIGTHQGAQTMSTVSVTDVAVWGSYAYVAESHAGIKVVDVSNPAAPEHVTTLETRISASDLATDGRYLYAVNNNKFISPYDLMVFQLMPENPTPSRGVE